MINVCGEFAGKSSAANWHRHGNNAVVMQCNLKLTKTGESKDENNGEKSR